MNILLVSLPGIYPSFPAVGLEMVAQGLREKGHSPALLYGHLEIAEFLDARLLRTLCQQNIWDLLYSFLVYPKDKVGLRNNSVLKMLTSPSHSYRLTGDDLVMTARAIGKFNHHLMRRIARFAAPAILGFNVQNNQLLVAKYFAREARAMWGSEVITLVGGASVRDGLAQSIVTHHPEFDLACEGNAVEGIDELVRGKAPHRAGGFFSRGMEGKPEDAGIGREKEVREYDLDYEEFYARRRRYEKSCDFSLFHPWDGIVAMLASGCRWGRCRFCNLRQEHVQHSVREVCDSIRRRSRRTGLSKVFLLDLSQPDSRTLREFLTEVEGDRVPYLFGAMFRCDVLKEDLIRFKKSGLDVCHLGIESYCDRLLQEMNKGVRLIDIAKTLITCVEEGILCEGNLLVNLPWETAEDVVETGKNLALLSHLPMPRIISYKLSHGSTEYEAGPLPRENWLPEAELRYAYPPRLRRSVAAMYYSERSPRLNRKSLWLEVIRKYKKYVLHPPQLRYELFEDGLLIHDTREVAVEKRWFLPGAVAAGLYLFCSDIRTVFEIEGEFPHVSEQEIAGTLEQLVSRKVMLSSDDRFLSLALRRA